MGLTNNLGKLSNMITSTGSAVGIAQASPAYTLDVSGTGRFTSTLLVSGAATFSSSVNIGASATTGKQLIVNQTGASGYFLSGEASGTEIAYWYYDASTIQFSSKSATRALTFLTNDTTRLTIASTGAATFSSNIFAGGSVLTSSSGADTIIGAFGGQDCSLILQDSVQLWELYVNDDFYINYGATSAITIKRTTGNVAIGTTTPNTKFNLVGNGTPSWTPTANNIACFSQTDTSGSIARVSIVSGNAGVSGLDFGDTDKDNDAGIFYSNATQAMTFTTAGVNNRLTITSGGAVLVNSTTSPNANHIMYVNGSNLVMGVNASVGGSAENMRFYNAGTAVGTITTTGSSTAYNTSSDYRLKQDYKNYNGLDLINAIKTYDFEFKADNSRMYGVIAHELAEVIPYSVTGEKDAKEMQSVDYSKLVPILLKAIQEQQAQIQNLQEQNQDLKSRLDKAGL